MAVLAGAACSSSENQSPDGPPADAARSPVLRVALDGDDAGDGTAQPVATLRRAFALALAHPEITDIELAAGRYEVRDAIDSYVPDTVKRLAGPPGGGAVLVGTGAEAGTSALVVTGGRIQDLAIESFGTAIRVGGSATIANVRVVGSGAAIHGTYQSGPGEDDDLEVHIENLDVSRGDIPAGRCVVGVASDRTAKLTITGFTARGVDMVLRAPFDANAAPSRIEISGANISASGDLACNAGALELGDSAFTLRDSVFEGGVFGINSYSNANVVIKNSTLRNQGVAFIGGGTFEITDTTITGTGTALSPGSGTWSLTRVTITGNGNGADFSGFRSTPLTVTMRGCDISRNTRDGIRLSGNVDADLGTILAPGDNVITGNTGVGLNVVAASGTDIAKPRITAIGNTWNASRQDADGDGRYIVVSTLTGPIGATAGNNFALATGISLQR